MQGFEFYIELQDIHELQSGGNSKNRSTGHAHLVQWKSNVLNKENCNYSSTLSLCNLLLIDYLPNDIDSMMIIASQFGGTAASLWKLDMLTFEVRHFKKYNTNLICMRNPGICISMFLF